MTASRYDQARAALDQLANWPDVARSTRERFRADLARAPQNPRLRAALRATEEVVAGLAARFDNADDATLEELRIELVYPLDDSAEEFFRAVV